MYMEDENLGSWLSSARKKLRKFSPSHLLLKKLTGKETLVDVFYTSPKPEPVSATPVEPVSATPVEPVAVVPVAPTPTPTPTIVQTTAATLPTQGYVVSPYATPYDNAPPSNYGNLTETQQVSQSMPSWALPVAGAALLFALLQRRR